MNNTDREDGQGGETRTAAWSCPCSPSDRGARGGRRFAGTVTPALLSRATIPRRSPRKSIFVGNNPTPRRGSGGGPRVPGALPRGRGRSLSPRGGRGMRRSAGGMTSCARAAEQLLQPAGGVRAAGTGDRTRAGGGSAAGLRAPGRARTGAREGKQPGCEAPWPRGAVLSARRVLGFATPRRGLPLRHSAGAREQPRGSRWESARARDGRRLGGRQRGPRPP